MLVNPRRVSAPRMGDRADHLHPAQSLSLKEEKDQERPTPLANLPSTQKTLRSLPTCPFNWFITHVVRKYILIIKFKKIKTKE